MQTVMSLMVEAVGRDPHDLPALDIDLSSLDTELKRFKPSATEAGEVGVIIAKAAGAAAGWGAGRGAGAVGEDTAPPGIGAAGAGAAVGEDADPPEAGTGAGAGAASSFGA